jgi:hypothetical protein
MSKITLCLWFNGNAEEAAKFYVSEHRRIGAVLRVVGRCRPPRREAAGAWAPGTAHRDGLGLNTTRSEGAPALERVEYL